MSFTVRTAAVTVLFAAVTLCFPRTASGGESGPITPEQAREKALALTGGGEVLVLMEHDSGTGPYFRVEVNGEQGFYHVEIDAGSGGLLQFIRKDRDRPGTAAVPLADTARAGRPLTQDEALTIALAQTGGGTVVETDVDRKRGGRIIYEFEIVNNGMKYEIDVDSYGNIVDFERKRKRFPIIITRESAPARILPDVQTQPTPQTMDAAQAQAAALERTGGGIVTAYSLAEQNGRPVHQITIVKDARTYAVSFSQIDGEMLEYSVSDQLQQ